MARDRFDIWLDQARAARLGGGWRIGLSVILSLAAALTCQMLLTIALLLAMGAGPGGFEQFSSFASTTILLLSFAGIWIGVFALRFWLHGLTPSTIWGWSRQFEWRPFWGGVLCAVLGRIGFLPLLWAYLFASGHLAATMATGAAPAQAGGPPDGLLWFAVLLFPMAILQSGAEEMLFRGHMTQILAARWRPWVGLWSSLPLLLFAGLHITSVSSQTEAGMVWVQILFAAGMGAITLAMTRAEGGISGAVGFHAMNNYIVFLLLFLSGGDVSPDAALSSSGLPPLSLMVTMALYLASCFWAFTTPHLPFGRWIGLKA